MAAALAMAVLWAASQARASQLVLKSSGGTMTLGTDFKVANASVASPPGTLSIDCPITATYVGTYAITYDCSGGSFAFQSSTGPTTVSARFSSGKLTLTASGGGRGGTTHYYYAFSGYFSGTQTVNGMSGAVNGQTTENIGPLTSQIGSGSAAACCGEAGITSEYTPIYVTDYSFSQLVRSDDLWGTNKQVLGGTGTGVNQFYGPHGVTVDSLGRIYVVDTYNCRIVRVSGIGGAGWTSFGACGSGVKQFSGATDIALDSSGRIYVADTGNNRIIRSDDMVGTNWTSFGTAGSGINQFIAPQGVLIDASGRIYIADTDNLRLVRVDNMSGSNWITLKQSPPVNGYSHLFSAPAHLAFDPQGRIVVGDGSNVVRVDDMTGANWAELNAGTAVEGVAVDRSGVTFVAGSDSSGGPGLELFDDIISGAGLLASNMVGQTGGIYALPVPSPVPAVALAPSSLSFGNQNIGTDSAAQKVTLTNFGTAALDISSIAASTGFLKSDDCGVTLAGGSRCTIAVMFAPLATGKQTGTLTITDNAFTGTQKVSLSGTGTAPIAGIAPSLLSFQPQLVNTSSSLQNVFLSNTGTGPLTFSGSAIATSGDFSQTDNCGTALAPNRSCTISVKFTPTVAGARSGTLTVTSNAAKQTVTLGGTGASSAPPATTSPESLIFPAELLNTHSPAQTVTLTNHSASAVSVASVGISGDFAKSGACPSSLGAGSSCVLSVTFTPTVAGLRTGALTCNLSTGTISAALTGTGVSSATGWLTVSPPSLAFNGYAVGDNPSQNVTVTNTNGVADGIKSIGVSGSSTFTQSNTCGSTLAAHATCTVTVTFNPIVAGSFSGTLAIVESAGSAHGVGLSGSATIGGN